MYPVSFYKHYLFTPAAGFHTCRHHEWKQFFGWNILVNRYITSLFQTMTVYVLSAGSIVLPSLTVFWGSILNRSRFTISLGVSWFALGRCWVCYSRCWAAQHHKTGAFIKSTRGNDAISRTFQDARASVQCHALCQSFSFDFDFII